MLERPWLGSTKCCGSTAASMGHGTRLRERKDCKQCRMYTVMPQSFQSFNIICVETILSSGDEQHEVLWLDGSYRGSWDPAMCCVQRKACKNVGCIGEATIFSIFQYYMYRDNSILRRRAARSAVARQQLPWVMGPGCVSAKPAKNVGCIR